MNDFTGLVTNDEGWVLTRILEKDRGRFTYTEKILFVNFTLFIRKFIIFIVALGHTRNVVFLLLKIIIFIIFVANFTIWSSNFYYYF